MKTQLENLLQQALTQLQNDGVLTAEQTPAVQLTRSKDPEHGDFATNFALMAAKNCGLKPRELAEKLVAVLPTDSVVIKTEIAGPGFINFFLSQDATHTIIPTILQQAENFGRSTIGHKDNKAQTVLVEFVSANPTGPLHVGHGRGAAYGAALADLLSFAGFNVEREYYVNDAGRQMDILATSVWLRYLALTGEVLPFPTNAYRGDYVVDISQQLKTQYDARMQRAAHAVLADLPLDAPEGDKELYIDALIARAKELLGDDYRIVFDCGLNDILADIRDDLAEFGVHYQRWFSERSLTESHAVEKALQRLQSNEYLYEQDGALWFRSTAFGDEKDRVVRRDNGQITYFASDIAYHLEKLERGYDRLIDIWGADHHGYIARVKAAINALGSDADKLDVLLVQFAILYRGSEKASMSTRSGEFVTLRELRHEIGNDAARFFYIMRRCDQHMDFDLDLAKSKSNENPVYYVQYAHARIASVLRELNTQTPAFSEANGLANLNLLTEPHEQALIKMLARFPEIINSAARAAEPHQVTYYLRDLATAFHSYYNAHKFLLDDIAKRDARLCLVQATRQVLRNALTLIGVSAPDSM
ncbi:MAG: arginine--tRNA ligase [Gammaproteobacteria bacterium]|nr:arginine--tRNA ligase [Gammaproteobacteria bacterium]